MKIDVKLIQKYYKQLTKIIDDYELNFANFYNKLDESLNYWQDNNAKKFANQIMIDKKESKKVILTLKELKKIYKNIYEKYSSIGSKINYIPKNKETLFYTFDSYIKKIDSVIFQINSLDLSFCPNERNQIINIKNMLINNQNKIKNLKYNTEKIINNIEKNETEIKKMISKLDYFKIDEKDYENYI